MAAVAFTIWRNCLNRSFAAQVRRGHEPDGAAELAFLSCGTEERAIVGVAVRAGIAEQTVLGSMQFERLVEKGRLRQLYQRAAADAARRRAGPARPAARQRTPTAPARARRPAAPTDPFTPLTASPAPAQRR